MTRFLTRYETQKDAPNYYSRDAGADAKKAVTTFKDPQPEVRNILRQYVTYKRNDGVTLSGTLYLPPGYKQGTKVPVIMWAYPREFGDADSASQVSGSPNSFTTIRGGSHMFLLLSGYAIFDNPTMPIIGPGETANDTYVEQLVASAQAAIDKVVEMGVADRDRIGVGGHSYGGFMTANLLAHSRLFRAGFAESGAYNRSLTPFGFQSERRSFWEAPDLYAKMSPFWYADKIKDPILLMHGEMDDNTGTFPINSERLYAALKGHGATVRLVMLPNEAHGYAARETLLHVIAERLNWFDKYVKNAGAKSDDRRAAQLIAGIEMPTAIDISSVVGLTAVGMFTAQILMGLLLSVGYNPIRQWPRQRWIKLFTFHNWLGYIGLATVAVHALMLLTGVGEGRHRLPAVRHPRADLVAGAAAPEHARRDRVLSRRVRRADVVLPPRLRTPPLEAVALRRLRRRGGVLRPRRPRGSAAGESSAGLHRRREGLRRSLRVAGRRRRRFWRVQYRTGPRGRTI